MTIIAAIYPITAVPARLALENKNWKLAANLELQEIDLSWKQFPWQEAIYHFAVAMGAANTNDFNTVERKIEVLKNLHQNLIAQNDKILTIQIKQIEIQFKTAQAWLYFRRNDLKNGLTLMQEAAEIERATSKHPITPGEVLPAIELLGDMFLELNRPEEALAVYEENLKGHPGRFNGIYGAAIAAKKSGNLEKTQRYFNQLIELTKGSSSNRVEITEAKEYLKNNAI
jgi:tetratricopeptide (TPR) repeat protein